MNEPKVSVIIPFYRAEKFLAACLDSILAQTYTNLEILCIGENVQDASHAVAQQYADAHPSRIRFLLQSLEGEPRTQGPGRARNIGVRECSGEYIAFVDADDTLHREYIQKLYAALIRNDADVACCGFERINGNTGKVLSREYPSASEDCILLSKATRKRMAFIYPAPWGKLYKRNVVSKVSYFERLPIACEDLAFFLMVLPNVQRFVTIPDSLYAYIMYDSGVIMNFTPQKYSISLENIYEACVQTPASLPGHKEMLTLSAFIHVGIALVHRVTQNGSMSYAESLTRSRSFLDEHFPEWRNIGPLPDGRLTLRGLAVYFMKLLYIYGGAGVFMRCYNTAIRLTGRDLKW